MSDRESLDRLARLEASAQTTRERQAEVEESVKAIKLTWQRIFLAVLWLVSLVVAILTGIAVPN
jgi:hypothetical protein